MSGPIGVGGPGRGSVIVGETQRRATRVRDKIELRAQMQESVHQHTFMLRERLLPDLRRENPGATEDEIMAMLDKLQPIYEEYDPVVQLAMMAVDHSFSPELRRMAASDAAQYVRPKLKSVELTVDPNGAAEQEKRALAERLRGLLDAGAAAKRDSGVTIDATARPSAGETEPGP
jgi:hypothetical protein